MNNDQLFGAKTLKPQKPWGLLQGTLLLVSATAVLLPVFILLIHASSLSDNTSFVNLMVIFLKAVQNMPSIIWVVSSIMFIAFAYVLGHLYYRQDPKIPNKKSFARLSKQIRKEFNECRDEEKYKEKLKEELACTSEEDCVFPFPYFDEYLKRSGIEHLRKFIIWKNNIDNRTKNYINILKVRLRFYYPDRCGAIIRNEAHIRFASSTWYVGRAVETICKIGFIGISISFALNSLLWLRLAKTSLRFNSIQEILPSHIGVLVVTFFVYMSGRLFRRRVERVLHYQRQREVLFILETAWTAFWDKPEILNPPFEDYYKEIQKLKSK
ncbi:MAG: hypothetical protein ACW98W_18920 [Candidatus Hodarchaeales archaeon]|jgi:hypothetical protein